MELAYVILAILIGFFIHHMIKCKREHLTSVEKNNKVDQPVILKTSTPDNQSVSFSGSLLNDKMDKEKPTHDFKSSFTYCPIEKDENEVTRYWREVALGGKYACPPPPPQHEYKFDDIQGYQDKFFGFNDNINQNSGMLGYDSVDRVNELYLQNNNELSDLKGVTIGELFNGLADNNKEKWETIYKRCTSAKGLDDFKNYGTSDDFGFNPNENKATYNE